MLNWFAYVQIPLELCFVPWCLYKSMFFIHAFTRYKEWKKKKNRYYFGYHSNNRKSNKEHSEEGWMSDFKKLNKYLWIIIIFLIPIYYRDNLDIQIGFHSNKNMILMVNWYPNINNICWSMLGIITTTTKMSNLTNSTISLTN